MAKYVTQDNLERYDTHLKEWASLLQRLATYNVGDVVQKGQNYLKCITAGMTDYNALVFSSTVPGTVLTDGTVEWQIIEPPYETGIRDWDEDIVYETDRLVIYQGSLYRCNTYHQSSSTFDDAKFDIVYAGISPNDPITLLLWQANTEYEVGDVVLYGGSIYKCVTFHSGGTADFDPQDWELVTSDLHSWESGTTYGVGTTVIYDNDIYICTVQNSDNTFDEDNWQRIGTVCILPWEKRVVYKEGSVVSFNGVLFSCNVDHTSDTTFLHDKDCWNLICANIAEWVGGPHKTGEVVIHNRLLYRALEDHASGAFTDNHWEEISPTTLKEWVEYDDTATTDEDPLVYVTFEDSSNRTKNYAGDIEMVTSNDAANPSTLVSGKVGRYALRKRYVYNGTGFQSLLSPCSWGWSDNFGVVKTYDNDGYVTSINISQFTMTFEAWVNFTGYSQFRIYVGPPQNNMWYDKSGNGYYAIGQYHTSYIEVTSYIGAFSGAALGSGWHHIAVEYFPTGSGTGMNINKYIDGTFISTTVAGSGRSMYKTFSSSDKVNSADICFAITCESGTSSPTTLIIDEVRMYNYLKYNGSDFTVPDPINFMLRHYPYIINEAVLYNNKLYRCLIDEETDTSWDSSHWELITSSVSSTAQVGDFTEDVDYLVDDMVMYGGNLYRCTVEHTSTTTFDASKWEVVNAGINDWEADRVYLVGDCIINGGMLYKCNTSHTSTTFNADIANWDAIGSSSGGTSIDDWQVSTSYDVGDIVIEDNKIYRCNTQHVSDSTSFVNDVSNWDELSPSISPASEWASNTDYIAGQIVTYNGDLYVVDNDFTSGATFSDTDLTWYGSTAMTNTEIQNVIDAF